jgi:hypothetical protein
MSMKRFFELSFRPFFVLTGIGTALGSLNAFWPRWTAETVEKIPFVQDYTIILQHWGLMLGLMGVFMIIAAFKVDWRNPILVFAALEKTFVVYLVVANSHQAYVHGFLLWSVRPQSSLNVTGTNFCPKRNGTPYAGRVTVWVVMTERNTANERGGQHERGSCSTYRLDAEGCT